MEKQFLGVFILHALQLALMQSLGHFGLSSLGRTEAHTMASIQAVTSVLRSMLAVLPSPQDPYKDTENPARKVALLCLDTWESMITKCDQNLVISTVFSSVEGGSRTKLDTPNSE